MDTPRHAVRSLDHLVTQWRSTMTCSLGRARNSAQVQAWRSPDSVVTPSCQLSNDTSGVGPAESTGKSSVRYWPGGSSTSWRPRPANPRVTMGISTPVVVHEGQHFPPRPLAGVGVLCKRAVE